jgi:hypothetical protein
MLNNEDIVFEQMAVSATTQNDASTTFKSGDSVSPFIAPMAVMVCSKLSFVKTRSIKTGPISSSVDYPEWTTV